MEHLKRMWLHPLVITAALAAAGLSAFVVAELVSGGLVSAMRRDYPDNVSLKALENLYPSNWPMIWVTVICASGLSLGVVGLCHSLARAFRKPVNVSFEGLNTITPKEVEKLQAELENSNVTLEKVGKVWR